MRKNTFVLLGIIAFLALAAGGYVGGAVLGLYGRHQGPGTVTVNPIPPRVVALRGERQRQAGLAVGQETPKQVLFGDLHVHTTFSNDAFYVSRAMYLGEGAHPPADACDFARYCSGLDFWSINDHAKGVSPRHWQETKESIRQCNKVAGDPANPDVVAFLGWEWTQADESAAGGYYGHRNVIFRDTAEDVVPTRPIAATDVIRNRLSGYDRGFTEFRNAMLDLSDRQYYFDFYDYGRELGATPVCPSGVPVRGLPANCMEIADTPRDLFEKLDDWGFPSIVIPHGTTWGNLNPPGSTWDMMLAGGNHDPNRQTLIEVYSGHGSAEEYRDWRAVEIDEQGNRTCPAPSDNYVPSCWRAGEIIRDRCTATGAGEDDCDRRAREARKHFVGVDKRAHGTVPGSTVQDWLDSGQCRDCFLAAYDHRPGRSAQYALGLTGEDKTGKPLRFRFGFVGSSDNHSARAGTGYKEFARTYMTDTIGPKDADVHAYIYGKPIDPAPFSEAVPGSMGPLMTERAWSFLTTGGLAAVHSAGRDREAIWGALERKEVYGTSGPRILLWFDLLNGPDDGTGNRVLPMGGEAAMNAPPRFRVRAVGAFKQKPGCPDYSLNSLTPERLQSLCVGECYNPGDERHLITRIEVVRIRPQATADEAMGGLIETPWKSLACTPDAAGCTVEFEDPTFSAGGRDTVYYVRAIQEPTPKVNAGALRCTFDAEGNCIEVNSCPGGYPQDPTDDCLADAEERAWSSPIFVDYRTDAANDLLPAGREFALGPGE